MLRDAVGNLHDRVRGSVRFDHPDPDIVLFVRRGKGELSKLRHRRHLVSVRYFDSNGNETRSQDAGAKKKETEELFSKGGFKHSLPLKGKTLFLDERTYTPLIRGVAFLCLDVRMRKNKTSRDE